MSNQTVYELETDATQKAVELLDKLTALSEKYAPKVYETALTVVQVQAVGELVLSATCLIFMYWLVKKALKLKAQNFFDEYDEALTVVTVIFVGSAIIVTSVLSLCCLFDVWNWIAVFNPELALANKVLNI